jgi:protein-tyrosine phosphatase
MNDDLGGCADPLARPAPFRVLVVCTGNLHRSPLAARLLEHRLAPARGAFEVTSAGTAAAPGTPMDPAATAVLTGLGVRTDGVLARRLTAQLVESADLVLGAATEHREAAVRLAPVWAIGRAFTLCEFARLLGTEKARRVVAAGGGARAAALVGAAAAGRAGCGNGPLDDIADPYGAPAPLVRACAEQIEAAVGRIAASLLGAAPEMSPGCQPSHVG